MLQLWFQTVDVKSPENYSRWNHRLPLKEQPFSDCTKHVSPICWWLYATAEVSLISRFIGFPTCLHTARIDELMSKMFQPTWFIYSEAGWWNNIHLSVSWDTCEQFYLPPQIIRYAEQRIPTLSEYCVICDEKHVFQNGPVLKVDNKFISHVGLMVERRKYEMYAHASGVSLACSLQQGAVRVFLLHFGGNVWRYRRGRHWRRGQRHISIYVDYSLLIYKTLISLLI